MSGFERCSTERLKPAGADRFTRRLDLGRSDRGRSDPPTRAQCAARLFGLGACRRRAAVPAWSPLRQNFPCSSPDARIVLAASGPGPKEPPRGQYSLGKFGDYNKRYTKLQCPPDGGIPLAEFPRRMCPFGTRMCGRKTGPPAAASQPLDRVIQDGPVRRG